MNNCLHLVISVVARSSYVDIIICSKKYCFRASVCMYVMFTL